MTFLVRTMEVESPTSPEVPPVVGSSAQDAHGTVNSTLQTSVPPGWEKLIHINDDNFKSTVLKHRDIFIMFHAKWCGHCSTVKPVFVDLAISLENKSENGNQASVATLAACDTDDAPSLVDEFHLIVLPTFTYVRNGEAVREYGGERTKDGFMEFLNRMSEDK